MKASVYITREGDSSHVASFQLDRQGVHVSRPGVCQNYAASGLYRLVQVAPADPTRDGVEERRVCVPCSETALSAHLSGCTRSPLTRIAAALEALLALSKAAP